MRGTDERSGELFSYVDLEDRVPTEHPLRLIRRIVNEVLVALDGEFTKLYADSGRPSIARFWLRSNRSLSRSAMTCSLLHRIQSSVTWPCRAVAGCRIDFRGWSRDIGAMGVRHEGSTSRPTLPSSRRTVPRASRQSSSSTAGIDVSPPAGTCCGRPRSGPRWSPGGAARQENQP